MSHVPIIYSGAGDTGITPNDPDKFGQLGRIDSVTIHHSAGPRAQGKAQALALHRAFQRQHISQGWGDIGYHFAVDDAGRIYRLRSTKYKGAHTGGHNTGNVGIMFHGNYDHDKLTRAQKATLKWLFRGGFYVLFGKSEQSLAVVRGHREWPGPTNATACPGRNLMRSLAYRRRRDFK